MKRKRFDAMPRKLLHRTIHRRSWENVMPRRTSDESGPARVRRTSTRPHTSPHEYSWDADLDEELSDVELPVADFSRRARSGEPESPSALARRSSPRMREDTLRQAARRASDSSSSTSPTSRAASGRAAFEGDEDIRSNPRRSGANNGASKNGASKNGVSNGSKGKRASSMLPPATRTPPRALAYEIAGVACLAVGALLLLNALRPLAEGFLPQIGVGAMRTLFGVGAKVLPAILCVLGVLLIARRHHLNMRAFGRGATVAFLVLLCAVHAGVPHGSEFDSEALASYGGYVGGTLSWALRSALGEAGSVIALVALSLISLLFWSEVSLAQVAARGSKAIKSGANAIKNRLPGQNKDQEFEAEYDEEEGESGDFDDEPAAQPHFVPQPTVRASRQLPREIVQDARSRDHIGADSNPNRAARSPFISVDQLLAEAGVPEAIPPRMSTHAAASDVAAAKEAAAQAPEAPDAPRIHIIDAPPPVSVVDAKQVNLPLEVPIVTTPVDIAPETPRSEDEMTPTEALEAQALATAGSGAQPKRVRPPGIRRRFGDGPPMPEYFDDAVRSLDPPLVPDLGGVEDDIQTGVKAVQDTLASFKIDARVTDVKRGPVITRYEVQPAPGVRVAAIANLDRDMARALSAIAVRIEAPVPGKDVIGIEVPNKRVHLVRLRDVLERNEFLAAPSKLAFVLGKDIAGQPKWADLTKMPHLLIAGATNSGKSVCLNSIIASILVRATPEEVKFSLIDPKRVELTLFKDIRHLYHPVVVEPKEAVRALRGSIAEMDRRYKRFAERGVRNIASYNSKLEEGEAPLPYLVIVIDELADLMMTAAAEFEKLICRIAQLARATGIHLIVATQRPSVNVITGVIKANIPSRIAFAVASQVDSRTILDSVGAERLIGSGDMLFDANNGGKATRIQGAYLSEEEVNRVVEVVKNHYIDDETPFEYEMDLDALAEDESGFVDEDGGGGKEEKRDSLYDDILEFVCRNTEMSASLIQRKFEIGYPRAGRIVDQLERDGVLSPPDGSKARKVIGHGRQAD
jgi:S-DNA-T family DNA segregation ATPase FtsK/SpoIIIE